MSSFDISLYFVSLSEGHLGHVIGVGANLELAGLQERLHDEKLWILDICLPGCPEGSYQTSLDR